MKIIKFKLYDNFLVGLFFFFLAFNYALTFRLGFPLKISEISLILIILLLLFKKRFKLVSLNTTSNKILAAFIILVALSTVINLFWSYGYTFKVFESRLSPKLDSILKLGYLTLAALAYLLTINVLNVNKAKYLKLMLIGSVIAAIYGWYLFISSFAGLPYLILPGMQAPLQKFNLLGTAVVRNGTFLEGNYMGLYLLLSGIVALYNRNIKIAVFLFISILSTVSTMAISCLGIFLALHFFKKYFTKRNLHKLLLFSIIGIAALVILSFNPAFRAVVIDKLAGDPDKITYASYSKADRLNTAYTAVKVALANPVLGVGISNYALHYDAYNNKPMFHYENYKVIPNNIYVEILAEVGILGLLLFVVFYLMVFKTALRDETGILKNGLIVLAIYYLTFPTFTILFVWVYFGLVASLELPDPNTEKYAIS
jgi:O-antigen ligase